MNFLTPNIVISLISSLVILIINYYINKRNKDTVSYKTYVFKYIILVLAIMSILFVKGKFSGSLMSGGGGGEFSAQPSYQSNINIGEPNF